MDYTPPPSYNSIDVESNTKSPLLSRSMNLVQATELWIFTNGMGAFLINYYAYGSLYLMVATIICLLQIFYIIYRIGSLSAENGIYCRKYLAYIPGTQLFLASLIHFSGRGLEHWITVTVYTAGLICIIFGYCMIQTAEDREKDSYWERSHKYKIYTYPLMIIAAIHLIDMTPQPWVGMAYFTYLSMALALAAKQTYINTNPRKVLLLIIRINAIMFFMYLGLSAI